MVAVESVRFELDITSNMLVETASDVDWNVRLSNIEVVEARVPPLLPAELGTYVGPIGLFVGEDEDVMLSLQNFSKIVWKPRR